MTWLKAAGLFKLPRWAWIGIAIAGLVLLLLWLIDAAGDHREAEIIQERTSDALTAEKRANAGDKARAQATREDHVSTQEELDHIHEQDPDGAKAAASPGSRAVAERLRDK